MEHRPVSTKYCMDHRLGSTNILQSVLEEIEHVLITSCADRMECGIEAMAMG